MQPVLVPLLHSEHEASQTWQTRLPSAYLPLGQSVQLVMPADTAYWPSAHSVHAVSQSCVEVLYLPASQLTHEPAFEPAHPVR